MTALWKHHLGRVNSLSMRTVLRGGVEAAGSPSFFLDFHLSAIQLILPLLTYLPEAFTLLYTSPVSLSCAHFFFLLSHLSPFSTGIKLQAEQKTGAARYRRKAK